MDWYPSLLEAVRIEGTRNSETLERGGNTFHSQTGLSDELRELVRDS